MTYQVLARTWRPRRFEEVVGQRGVTETLRNAIISDRLAQAFVFSGPRGVGKTTTARILSRALNCEQGPTPDPCGTCDACVEIADGRDIDVLEIDAATHTQVENIREVIIAGLAMAPVRDRYKIFIIDEFHQLSSHSFNALLKSIEEPPPHATFMMATTRLDKIPDTILSRSQVFEFRTIGVKAITGQLRKIASSEEITVDEAALTLIANSADGSMRDAESAFDQVIAFAGKNITANDVSDVLGLVGRVMLFDVIEAVANEDGPAMFRLAGHFVEAGYDLRMVCRELSRAVRDLMVVSIDITRLEDPEIATEDERERLRSLINRFSREDLLRSFDVLARAESELRSASQPRYHLEMALLRWIHLRKLVPLTDIIESIQSGQLSSSASSVPLKNNTGRPPVTRQPSASDRRTSKIDDQRTSTKKEQRETKNQLTVEDQKTEKKNETTFKSDLLAEIQRTKKFFYGTVVAQAQKIEFDGDQLAFTFSRAHRTLVTQFNQSRSWLEQIAEKIAGRRISVVSVEGHDPHPPEPSIHNKVSDRSTPKERVMDDSVVKAMFEVFPAEIKGVEEI